MKQSGGWKDKGSRHDRGYGSAWVKLRTAVMQRDGYLCQPCLMMGKPTPATAVDHIVPKAKGGTDDADNCQSICDECHTAKTQMEAAEAQGRTCRRRVTIGKDGWPVE